MATISTAALLEAWERGRDVSPGERGLMLLGVAHPEALASALSRWPVGRRDAALLAFYGLLFGPRLAAQTTCPRCAALLELEVDVAQFSASAPHEISEHFVFESAGHRVTYRLPSAGDLAALDDRTAGGEGEPPLRRWLLHRCIVQVEKEGAREAEIPAEIAPVLESEIADTIAAADPLAEIALEMKCPVCAVSWSAPFDIVSFLWDEVHAWASHVLDEVHVLASSYGWSQTEILALSAKRRQHYRDLIGS
jgi:hypothetical protein